MARRIANGSGKETTSFSLRSATIEGLGVYADLMEITNLSEFVDKAIREKIGRDLTRNPVAWKKISQLLIDLSS